VYALGQVNFPFDSSGEPHRTADELSTAFGVAKTTMSGQPSREAKTRIADAAGPARYLSRCSWR
jgi:hypothetical protein